MSHLPHRRTSDGSTQAVGDKDADSMSLEDVLDLSMRRLPHDPKTNLAWEIWTAHYFMGATLPPLAPREQALYEAQQTEAYWAQVEREKERKRENAKERKRRERARKKAAK